MKKYFFAFIVMTLMVAFGANAQLGGALNKMKDKASGSGGGTSFDGSKVQPDAAIQNVERNLKSITESYYADYQSKGIGYLNGDGQLWFIRKTMEASRHYYSGGKLGYHSAGLVCELGAAQQDPRYVALAPKFKDAEEKVKEMEKAKGYEFVECADNNIIFREIKTGRVLSADESSKI
ncbi:MAG: hypothetical protein QM786_07880 [Breznakibacter sp.]